MEQKKKMASRVKPVDARRKEAHERVVEEQDNPQLVLQEAVQISYQGDEGQLKAIETIYRPVLTLMKLCGMYFGETSFDRIGGNASDHGSTRLVSISRIYCCVLVAGLWFTFAMALVSLCVEGASYLYNFYTILTLCMWFFISSLVATTCLVVLPLTEKKKSRFEKFLQSLIKRRVDMENVQSHCRKAIILAGLIMLTSMAIMIASMQLMPELSIAHYKPWNKWYGFKVLALVSQSFSLSVWLLPIQFFISTCLLLEKQFDSYCKRVSSSQNSNSVDLTALKEEHCRLCETVELAEKMFSPLLLEIVSIYIPLLCFNFYAAVNPPLSIEEHSILVSIMSGAYWLLGSFAILFLITVFGSRVNEKVSK